MSLFRRSSILFVVLVLGCSSLAAAWRESTDYEAELLWIDNALKDIPVDGPRRAYLLYRRATLTGNLDELAASRRVTESAIRQGAFTDELLLLKLQHELKFHRLNEARSVLADLPESPVVLALKGDVDLQEGRLEDAMRAYEDALRRGKSWDVLARIAYLDRRPVTSRRPTASSPRPRKRSRPRRCGTSPGSSSSAGCSTSTAVVTRMRGPITTGPIRRIQATGWSPSTRPSSSASAASSRKPRLAMKTSFSRHRGRKSSRRSATSMLSRVTP